MNKCFIFLTLILSLSMIFASGVDIRDRNQPGKQGLVRQAFMERSPGQFDPVAYLKDQQETYNWLMAESVPLSPESIITIQITEEDLAGIENYECESCGGIRSAVHRVRIGVVKHAGVSVSFNNLWANSLSRTNEGGFVWTTAIESPGATALRVHFTNFSLPPNAELYIYNLDGTVFGPYTNVGPLNDGEFWSNTVSGAVAFLQLRHYGAPTKRDLQGTHFEIKDVGYLGEKFLLPFLQQTEQFQGDLSATLELCSYNEPCVEDASCYSGTAINNAKYAVAHMQWVSGAWLYYCSGGLIADTVSTSQIPYFLTANHCISRAKPAKSLECYWQYWTDSCQGACYDPVGIVPRTLGADIVSTNRTGDYTLMQLWVNPPPGSVFMGWTSVPVAFSDGTELFRISHPQGAPQAYSKHQVDVDAVTCTGWDRGNWIYSRDVIGATEGGSSGSPVYNLSGQIVGQLTGACGYNVNDPCDFISNATVDGAFASYFDEVAPWLDPGGSPGAFMFVFAIDPSIKSKGPKTDAIATVTIYDENNNPLEGAQVTGTFSGDVNETNSAATDRNGVATLKISMTGAISTFTFCVDNVSHPAFTYDPNINLETCDTY